LIRWQVVGSIPWTLVREDFPGLSPLQLRVLDAVRTGTRFYDAVAAAELARLRFPIHFVDFETFGPPLPLYRGTRPYQTIPFQWSDHILNREGEILHREFLHEGPGDPRRRFAGALALVAHLLEDTLAVATADTAPAPATPRDEARR